MSTADDQLVSRYLQEAADHLCSDLADQVLIKFHCGTIIWSTETWSPAMTRSKFEMSTPKYSVAPILSPRKRRDSWPEIVLRFTRDFLSSEIGYIRRRHACAQALGLIHGDRRENLPSSRIRIDRALWEMLVADGIDVRAGAAAISADEPDTIPLHFLDQIYLPIAEDDFLWVLHEDMGTPILGSSRMLPLGWFDGSQVTIPHPLPETAMIAAVGRRLGELVETRMPALDRRRILAVSSEVVIGELRTNLQIEQDLIELGAA